MGTKKPSGLLRFAFRLPVWLYRLGLGWVLGSRFLLLTHQGRKSGREYQTVIEVIRYDRATDTYYVVSGYGTKADWYRNIEENPNVSIQVGRRKTDAKAEILSAEKGAEELRDYAKRHPTAFRNLSRYLLGYTPDPDNPDFEQVAESMPVIAFHCE